jgi:hypothetical protein
MPGGCSGLVALTVSRAAAASGCVRGCFPASLLLPRRGASDDGPASMVLPGMMDWCRSRPVLNKNNNNITACPPMVSIPHQCLCLGRAGVVGIVDMCSKSGSAGGVGLLPKGGAQTMALPGLGGCWVLQTCVAH